MATPPSPEKVSPGVPSRNGQQDSGSSQGILPMLGDPRTAAAEAYRTLAANLLHALPGQALSTIAVASAAAGDGRSLTAANLGIALAETGHNVVLLDADLRRPTLHTLFKLDNRLGLTTALADPTLPLPLVETGVPGLKLLASGPVPVNPAEVLGSAGFRQLIERARGDCDLLILDTPPAAALADTALIAPLVDGVLLVVRAGKTRRDLAQRTKEQIQRVDGKLLGVVLTGARGGGSGA